MGLAAEQLEQVQATLATAADVRSAASLIRTQFPGLKALVIDADDMREETATWRTAGETGGVRCLYLVTTDGHCWSVTHQPEHASGVILTQQ